MVAEKVVVSYVYMKIEAQPCLFSPSFIYLHNALRNANGDHMHPSHLTNPAPVIILG